MRLIFKWTANHSSVHKESRLAEVKHVISMWKYKREWIYYDIERNNAKWKQIQVGTNYRLAQKKKNNVNKKNSATANISQKMKEQFLSAFSGNDMHHIIISQWLIQAYLYSPLIQIPLFSRNNKSKTRRLEKMNYQNRGRIHISIMKNWQEINLLFARLDETRCEWTPQFDKKIKWKGILDCCLG